MKKNILAIALAAMVPFSFAMAGEDKHFDGDHHKKMQDEIKNVLTPEQQSKMDKMHSKMKDNHKERTKKHKDNAETAS